MDAARFDLLTSLDTSCPGASRALHRLAAKYGLTVDELAAVVAGSTSTLRATPALTLLRAEMSAQRSKAAVVGELGETDVALRVVAELPADVTAALRHAGWPAPVSSTVITSPTTKTEAESAATSAAEEGLRAARAKARLPRSPSAMSEARVARRLETDPRP